MYTFVLNVAADVVCFLILLLFPVLIFLISASPSLPFLPPVLLSSPLQGEVGGERGGRKQQHELENLGGTIKLGSNISNPQQSSSFPKKVFEFDRYHE